MNTDKINKYLAEWYERNEKKVRVLMHTLWAHPEVALKEYYACDTIVKFLQQQGFVTIETHAAENWKSSEERPNTVIASWGHGKPVIGIVGELDALPNLGNENVPRRQALEGPGHACGHNLMGGGAAAAASALRYAMEKEELHGTIRLIEAPAEEIGVGKAYLAKNGVFSDLDMALMWHPAQGKLDISPVNQTVAFRVEFSFYGKSAHASGMPWEGRSALDAVQLMNLGCEFMREHIKPHVRVHYYIPNGGSAPNIVPDYASVVYMFRALDDYGAAENVMERAVKCAEGQLL
ncbi:amidohydrolase [Roseburia hominis]